MNDRQTVLPLASSSRPLWRCLSRVAALLLMLSAFGLRAELAGPYMAASRVIYPEGARNGVSAVFKNNGTDDYLIQAFVVRANAVTGLPAEKVEGFLITPPVTRVNAGENHTLRVLHTGGALPAGREAVFYLVVRLLPVGQAGPENVKGGPHINVVKALSSKIFYRPSGLPDGGVDRAARDLTASVTLQGVTLRNPSPFWVTLRTLSVNGKAIPGESLFRMLPPFGQQQWALPPGVSPGGEVKVAWRAVGDSGFDTDEVAVTAKGGR
ncbi:TPA: molecular chaperone [Serratia liquefaciens]